MLHDLSEEADLRHGVRGLGDEFGVGGLFDSDGADFMTELCFGPDLAEFAHGLVHGVFGFPGVTADAVEGDRTDTVGHRIDVERTAAGPVERGFGLTTAFEVLGAIEDPLEDDFLEWSVGDELRAEADFELGEIVLLAGEDDEVFGRQRVTGCVPGGCGFAGIGARAG